MNRSNDTPENSGLSRGSRPQLRSSAPPMQPRRVVDMPNLRRSPEPSSGGRYPAEGRRLVVSKDITLAGQISKCDFLVVEGVVEGMRYEGQALEVTETGAFSGGIEVENVEVSGNFEGTMMARGRLTIRPTGRVSGNIRYGEIEIQAGGQIIGEITVLEGSNVARPASNAVATTSGVTPQEPPPGDGMLGAEQLAGE